MSVLSQSGNRSLASSELAMLKKQTFDMKICDN
jgi:hypothetical protein